MEKNNKYKLPYTHSVIMAVLAFVVASGGAYGGYYVAQEGASPQGRGSPQRVAEVIDGDTLEMTNGERVRLLAIDAPEDDECYAEEAREGLWQLVAGKEIRLDKDMSGEDSHERLLRYVVALEADPTTDNVLVNRAMVEQGLAKEQSIAPDKLYESVLETAEERARENERGIWGACEVAEGDESSLREVGSDAPGEEYVIKGNISEKGYGKNYFLPGCPNYKLVKVDTRKGEAWFASEEDAIASGFSKSESCENTF